VRAYHRIDPLMDERKSHYSPAQFGAFLKVQLVAGRQSSPGAFRSFKALVGSLPAAYARLVPFLIEQGDLVEQPDGSLYLDGWKEWQEGDLTVGERMRRLRNKPRHHAVTNGVTPTVTQPSPAANAKSDSLSGSTTSGIGVGVGVEARPSQSPSSDATELQVLAEELTGQAYVMADLYGGLGLKAIDEQLRPHGLEKVSDAWRKVAAKHPAKVTLRQLVLEGDDLLNPLSSPGKRETPAEREDRDMRERVAKLNAEAAARRATPQGVA
jgi:hypothetical protein